MSTTDSANTVQAVTVSAGQRALDDALQAFQDELTEEEREHVANAGVDNSKDVEDLVVKINLVNKKKNYGRIVLPFLQYMCNLAPVIDTLVQAGKGPIGSLVWGGIKLVLVLATNFLGDFEKITTLFARIGNLLPNYYIISNILKHSGPLEESILELHALSSKQLLKTTWKPFKARFNDIEQEFAIRREDVEAKIKLASEEAAHTERQLQVTYRDQGYQHRRMQIDEWTKNNQIMMQQRKDQKGKTGAGKSFVMATIIESLSRSTVSPSTGIIYFFVDWTNTDSLELQTVLCSLIKQILSLLPDIPAEVINTINKLLNHIPVWNYTNELFQLLSIVISYFKTVFLIVDGIEELPLKDREQFLQFFEKKTWNKSSYLKTLISGRFEIDVLRSLPDSAYLSLDDIPSRPDIKMYIEKEVLVRFNSSQLSVSNHLAQEITRALVTRCQGMFLWVSLQLDYICDQDTDTDILDVLDNLPRGLNETYERNLLNIIHKRNAIQATKTFQWLAHAKRPMTLSELSEAISLQENFTYYQQIVETRPNDELRIIKNCGGMVVYSKYDETLLFAHTTALKYLQSCCNTPDLKVFDIIRASKVQIAKHCIVYMSFSDFDMQVTKKSGTAMPRPSKAIIDTLSGEDTMVKRLATFSMKQYGKQDNNTTQESSAQSKLYRTASRLSQSLPNKFALLEYLSQYWLYHWTAVDMTEISEKYKNMLADLLFQKSLPMEHLPYNRTDSAFARSMLTWSIINNNVFVLDAVFSHFASLSRHDLYKEKLINGMDAITVASEQGFLVVVNYLLDNSILIRPGKHLYKPLVTAARMGHLTVVGRLLATGVDVNTIATADGERTILQTAAAHGHIEVAKVLLDTKADINSLPASKDGRTALQAAAEGGHLAMVEFLVSRGAKVNAAPCPINGRTALQAAAEGGHLEVVDRLLRAGADVDADAASVKGKTALSAAEERDHDDVIALLKQWSAK